MEEDDFEYDITFPTPRGLSLNEAAPPPDSLEDFEYEGDTNEPEPVIFLLGWAGCKDKYLAKYSEFYEQKGCISIRYTAPTEISYFNSQELQVIAKKLLDLIPDYSLENNPVFFHVFSNNGCSVYAQISDLLCSGQYKNIRVKGCIIDSAPGKRRIARASYAFALASGRRGMSIYATFLYIYVYLCFTGIKTMIYSILFGKDKSGSPHTLYERIKEDSSRWPQLFFYSKGDKVIPYTDSEEVMNYRAEVLKVQTESQCYDESDHCSHLRTYRESYIANCYRFIDRFKLN